MPRKKKVEALINSKPEISVGLVKSFEFYDEEQKGRWSGHPSEGRVYRLIKDFDPTNNTSLYRLHIGRENNERGLDGLILGFDLKGESENLYKFEIIEITKSNFLDYNLSPDDITKLSGWFDTDNEDLKQLLGLKASVVDDDTIIASMDENDVDPKQVINIVSFLEKQGVDQTSLAEFPGNFDKIFFKDVEMAKVLADFTQFVSTTYDDKYEDSGRANDSKEFLLTSKSPDTAIFNVKKYLQRYTTVGFEKSGNIKDLYKALHYITFELIRLSRQNG